MRLWGGIEAGGTNFVCGVGTGPDDLAREEFRTGAPRETIRRAAEFFRRHGPLTALGVGSFGPLDRRRGAIANTPKEGWADVPVVERLRNVLGPDLPIAFDTDVNVAALGEHRWGAAQGLSTFVYLTVGTGIGGGAMLNGQLLHGLIHPEMGHLRIPHDRSADDYPGSCPAHGDCWEGLASGEALVDRWRRRGALSADQGPEALPTDHEAWALEAEQLALGVANLVLTLSPQRIIVGGGVMRQAHLYERVRQRVQALLAGYVRTAQLGEGIGEYIVPPRLGDDAGVLGAIALAQRLAPHEGR